MSRAKHPIIAICYEVSNGITNEKNYFKVHDSDEKGKNADSNIAPRNW